MTDTPAEPVDPADAECTIGATPDGDGLHTAASSGNEELDTRLGTLIDSRYQITRKLGDGGMGAVYEAEHVALGGRVAVKFLHPQHVTDADTVRRFLQEARAAASIGHPGIAKALDVGRTAEGGPFLALELLEGHDLFSEIAQFGPLPIGRAVCIAREVAAALGAAHAKGIVHRDLKPGNIFLAHEQGIVRAKVLDFGISKIRGAVGAAARTEKGAILGTPAYMAPEQFADASDVDARADVYALGGVLYAMLTGQRPFESPSFPRLVLMVMTERPTPLGTLRSEVPPGLVDIVERAMARQRADRYVDMATLDAALAPFDTDAGKLAPSAVSAAHESRSSSTQTDPHAATVSMISPAGTPDEGLPTVAARPKVVR